MVVPWAAGEKRLRQRNELAQDLSRALSHVGQQYVTTILWEGMSLSSVSLRETTSGGVMGTARDIPAERTNFCTGVGSQGLLSHWRVSRPSDPSPADRPRSPARPSRFDGVAAGVCYEPTALRTP